MIDDNDYELGVKIGSIFIPGQVERGASVRDGDVSFVHYTSVEAAFKIIRSEEVWLRNARVMNDFLEIQHGQNCLKAMWDDPNLGGKFKAFLEGLRVGAALEFAQLFDSEQWVRNKQSFIFSMSEHDHSNPIEESYGRLSMWRAYGRSPNVAMIFDKTPFFSKSTALAAGSMPVIYEDSDAFKVRFVEVIRRIEENKSFLSSFDSDALLKTIRYYLSLYTLCLKHPSFSEEKEWRMICTPVIQFPESSQGRIGSSIEIIGGVAQRVLKIRMKDYPEEGLVGATLPAILKEIVIGPCDNPFLLSDAFVQLLADKGIVDPEKRVRISHIPLRR